MEYTFNVAYAPCAHHPAAFVTISVIITILTALASALPRTITGSGLLYCTDTSGLAAYYITHD